MDDMQTLTTTQTKTVTNTKLAVATLALAIANLAFVMAPAINPNVAPPVMLTPVNNSVVSTPLNVAVYYRWTTVSSTLTYRFNLDFYKTANGTSTWTTVFDYNRGNYTSNYTLMSNGAGAYRVRVQALLTDGTASPFSTYNYFTYNIIPQPDLAFSTTQNPEYASGTVKFAWGNLGTTSTRFLAGQPVYRVDALDSMGRLLASSTVLAGNDGSGGITYRPGSMVQASTTFKAPSSTLQIRIVLDPKNLIKESNEKNNVAIINLPIPFSCAPGACENATLACNDSDGGYSYYVKGAVTQKDKQSGTIISYTDTCNAQATSLVEGVCGQNATITTTTVSCNCVDGACAHSFSCTDTDGGKNVTVSGTVKISDTTNNTVVQTVKDVCYYRYALTEAFCLSSTSAQASTTAIYCANGQECSNGACVPYAQVCTPGDCENATQTCTDSDGGYNWTLQGTVTVQNKQTFVTNSFTDTCSSPQTIVEGLCGTNANFVTSTVNCTCVNGQCQ